MQDIKVSRYENPKATGWAGWIEPADGSWIAFIDLEGRPRFYLNRDATGRVLPDDASNPGAPDKDMPVLRASDGVRIEGEGTSGSVGVNGLPPKPPSARQ